MKSDVLLKYSWIYADTFPRNLNNILIGWLLSSTAVMYMMGNKKKLVIYYNLTGISKYKALELFCYWIKLNL